MVAYKEWGFSLKIVITSMAKSSPRTTANSPYSHILLKQSLEIFPEYIPGSKMEQMFAVDLDLYQPQVSAFNQRPNAKP
jgi:hypothetical protein